MFIAKPINKKIDLLFFEFKENDNTDIYKISKNIIIMLYIICNTIIKGGTIIFKLEDCFYKIVIDFIYILSNLFDKIIVIKPTISNITDSSKFFICKGFNYNQNNISNICNSLLEQVYTYCYNINNVSNIVSGIYINSILENKIPYYFINKLEEFNVIISQQQIDSIDQIIFLLKNKNKAEKIESIKKTNISKAIQWCEKYNVPHIKLLEKSNIFFKRNESENIINNNNNNDNDNDNNNDNDSNSI